jgi:hypothetical protein
MIKHEVLRKSLPKHQKYLSRVFGFVGPENVLEPWLQAALEEKIQSGEFLFTCRRVMINQTNVILLFIICMVLWATILFIQ